MARSYTAAVPFFNQQLGLRHDEAGAVVLDTRDEHQVAPGTIHFAVLATVGNFQHGEVHAAAGLAIAVLLVAGVLAGARLAHRLPGPLLKRSVAMVLVAVGIFMAIRIIYAASTAVQA